MDRILAQKARSRKWYLANRQLAMDRAAQWAKDHPQARKVIARKHDQSASRKISVQRWYAENKTRLNQSRRVRRKTYTRSVIADKFRTSIRLALKARGVKKDTRTAQLLGCSLPQLRTHLESLFQPLMTWENHGRWHIDHKRPCASFDLTNPEQQRACFHYTNLQPLWATDNLTKGAQWTAS